jgi:isoleucyl-tRNA synthetase
MAPAYGEADFYALQAAGLDVLVDPVDVEGNFTEAVPEVAGLNIKDADHVLISLLKEQGSLFRNERIHHPYPFCYRTDTPLMYKAIPTWFIKVEPMRMRMAELNANIHWVPEYVGSKRFGNWLEDARDWAVSRNRYWGSCIPVWECETCGEQACVGSIDDLESLSGQRPQDLHKHIVDLVVWPCQCGKGTMRRVPEVLDCWFESGSMPYAQVHYPFENRERFERSFPAHFIAEGLDQTRSWFYTLVVLATALFDREPFRNCIVNGLILAEDGRKMSKSLKNYPDPTDLLDRYSADALRAYLISSPAVRAEPLRFSESGVREMVRTVLLPLWNAYSFFTTYAEADGITRDDLAGAPSPGERPELDRWILSVLQSLIAEVNAQMEGYYLYAVIPPTLGFIDDLTNWYLRRSRRRFWRTRGEDDADKLSAFATLYEVLTTFCKVLAPILPFITEHLYQDLVAKLRPDQPPSVHLCDYPVAEAALIDTALEESMAAVRRTVTLGHGLRKRHQLRVRQPLRRLTVITRDLVLPAAVLAHQDLIADELNVKEIEVRASEVGLVRLSAKADFGVLGPKLGASTKAVASAIASLSDGEVGRLLDGEIIVVGGHKTGLTDVVVERSPHEGLAVASEGDLVLAFDTNLDGDLITEGVARELVSRIQALRKEAGLDVVQHIAVNWWSEDDQVRETFKRYGAYIAAEVLAETVAEGSAASGSAFGLDGAEVYLEVSV